LPQTTINKAIDDLRTCKRLNICVLANGGHFDVH